MINIVKVGGGIIEKENDLATFLKAFSEIPGKKILVHGGGRLATKFAEKLDVSTQMIEGRRVTDDAMLEIVTMVYGGLTNKKIVAKLQANNINALGLSGADGNVIKAHKRPVKTVDYGWVGDVDDINVDLLLNLLDNDIVPVIAPLTHDGAGQMLNTNADTIASSVASAISKKADVQLVLGFELDGVLVDFKDKGSVITKINPELFEQYKQDGTITDGMIPKLTNAFNAIEEGVQAVKICNAMKINDAITKENIGTTITA